MHMKLRKVIITGFLSVKKEIVLLVDDRISILIGANDHGKTNLLTAVQRLNDDSPFGTDDRNWDLKEGDKAEIQWAFAPSPETLTKLTEMSAAPESEAERASVPVFPINTSGEIIFSRDSVDNKVRVVSLPVAVPVARETELLALRPRVEFFTQPKTNLVDQVNRGTLETPDFEFMQGIFMLAGIWERRDTIFTQTDTNTKLLDEASTLLTGVLNDKWNQGKNLKWKLTHTGTNGDHITIQIEDPSIEGRYTRPSLRSSGFRTYFLLSMITLARTQKNPNNAHIYLFDEPGTYLHPHAQLDLQRSFETLADRAQLLYTTHSLFLINKNYPDRNRVISKTKAGTLVDQKPFAKNWKAVRDSLGILLSNNFLIAEKTLLVEGPSDVIYLLDAIKRLKASGAVDIDLNDLSVVDAGTSENYVAMAKLMLSEGRDVVALVDGDSGGKQIASVLSKVCEKELKEKHLTVEVLLDGKSTEDVFPNLADLKEGIRKVTAELTHRKLRKLKAGVDLETAIAAIKSHGSKTLGHVIDEVTTKWFDPEEKMSKLQIALEYENVAKPESVTPSQAIAVVEKMRTLLNLRGERAAEGGVFDEVG